MLQLCEPNVDKFYAWCTAVGSESKAIQREVLCALSFFLSTLSLPSLSILSLYSLSLFSLSLLSMISYVYDT
jgi:hypothetical protein